MRVPCAAAVVAAALSFVAACAREPAPSNQPSASLAAASDRSAPAALDVTGFNTPSLRALASRSPDAAAWSDVIRLDVLHDGASAPGPGLPPVAGRYAVSPGAVRFTPAFPFEPGVRYQVRVDATGLPGGAPAVVTSVIVLPAIAIAAPPAAVTSIAPGGSVIPENVLRVYLHFSAPMARRGAGRVRLLDQTGQEVVDPFLPLEAELWSGDHTRYTLFFDPGRVKTGIRPNEELGRALVAGRRYTLVVESDWKDAHGRPLAAPFRREFRAGPAFERPIDPKTWRVRTPRPATREGLVVTFPGPLDEGLLARAIGVETKSGTVVGGVPSSNATQTEWRFVPDQPWQEGAYALSILGILEDPSGNRVGRAFEVESDAADSDVDRTVLPFIIAP